MCEETQGHEPGSHHVLTGKARRSVQVSVKTGLCKRKHPNQNLQPHVAVPQFQCNNKSLPNAHCSLLITCKSQSHSLIFDLVLVFGCRVRRRSCRCMQSSTSSVRQSTRRMWKTFSERPPKEPWPSIKNRSTIRGRRNVLSCDVKRTRGVRTKLSW